MKESIAVQANKLRFRLEMEARNREKSEMANDETATTAKKKVAKKASAKAPEKAAPKKTADKGGDEGGVTLAQAADRVGVTPREARKILRDNDVEKPDGFRYVWKDGSKALNDVIKLLSKAKEKSKEA